MPNTPAPWSFTYPGPTAPLVPWQQHFQTLAESIANAMVNNGIPLVGTTANLPAFGVEGRTYYATDTNILWFDTGSAWKNRTPGIFVGALSATGAINGTNTLSWQLTAASLTGVDTGGFYSAGAPTRLTMPYAGMYEMAFTGRTNGIAPCTWQFGVNGTLNAYLSASAVGASGAATSASRSVINQYAAGDYLTCSQISTATALSSHTIWIKYLGEF